MGVKWQMVDDQRNNPPSDVTGICITLDEEDEPVATADDAKVFIPGVSSNEFLARGVVMASGCDTYGITQSMAYTLTSGLTIQVVQWTLRKGWALQPVHNGDTEEFLALVPVIQVAGNGWATGASGPGMTTGSLSAMTLIINGFGQLACRAGGTGFINTVQQSANFRDGGGIPCAFSALYSGGVTYTGTNFEWLFPTPDLPVKGVATLITGETRTSSVLAHDWTFQNRSGQGGAIDVSAIFKWDKA